MQIDLLQHEMYIEFFGSINFYIALGAKVLTAIFLGLIIGIDREKKFKSAGVKTQIMICVGATIYTSISLLTMTLYRIGDNVDPNRLTAQIVSGIGFLGAGAIIQNRGSVVGLTTAATIWVVAAIGIAVGSGYIFSATFFTLTIILILNLIEPIIRIFAREHIFQLEVQAKSKAVKDINRILEDMEVDILETEVFGSNDESDRCHYHLAIRSSNRRLRKLVQFIRSHSKVDTFTHRVVKR